MLRLQALLFKGLLTRFRSVCTTFFVDAPYSAFRKAPHSSISLYAPTDPTIPLLRSIIDYNLLNGCHIIGLDL
jgi:hypothetical protein